MNGLTSPPRLENACHYQAAIANKYVKPVYTVLASRYGVRRKAANVPGVVHLLLLAYEGKLDVEDLRARIPFVQVAFCQNVALSRGCMIFDDSLFDSILPQLTRCQAAIGHKVRD